MVMKRGSCGGRIASPLSAIYTAVPEHTARAWSLGQGVTIRAPPYRAVNSEQGGQAADHSLFIRARIMKVPYDPHEPSGVLSLHMPGVTVSVFPGS